MKTQIIQLEPHDDTLSVRDKMDWSQAPRILLIWPDTSKVLRSKLDLILLERYSSANGSQLAIISKDNKVIYQAEKAGVPVFDSRREAQIQPWRKSARDFQRQELGKLNESIRKAVKPGSPAFLCDNNLICEMVPDLIWDDNKINSYKIRQLENGNKYKILKNYFSREELTEIFEDWGEIKQVMFSKYYWAVALILK